MNAAKKHKVSVDAVKRFSEADLEAMLRYYRSSHPDANELEVKNFQKFLHAARKFEAKDNELFAHHRGAKLATALSGSAAAGLTTAITAPMAPMLVIMTAIVGLVVGWVAATKAVDDSTNKAPSSYVDS
ncbi:hypothetical protein [Pseudomonas umsongensis]|jgi:hypothetical protein|uniref:hypothetical protein n=1 Tax=Pseudomonas umsongensis TaxID=198618 RepID=UPI0015C0B900|nr:hypothetical protein [Pseudomonas umsongensis]NWL21283.1 hypothetical protein [Pseudomonas umsongensis]